jgi:hypothetical protein
MSPPRGCPGQPDRGICHRFISASAVCSGLRKTSDYGALRCTATVAGLRGGTGHLGHMDAPVFVSPTGIPGGIASPMGWQQYACMLCLSIENLYILYINVLTSTMRGISTGRLIPGPQLRPGHSLSASQ